MTEHNSPLRKVYVVGQHDYGDNGWGIRAVFDTRKAAHEYIASIERTRSDNFYYEVEEWTVQSDAT